VGSISRGAARPSSSRAAAWRSSASGCIGSIAALVRRRCRTGPIARSSWRRYGAARRRSVRSLLLWEPTGQLVAGIGARSSASRADNCT
jgi:hypothetical protein